MGNWTHVMSALGVHMIDIGCQTHGFGTHFSWWHSPCQCVLFFFLAFCNGFCIHELAKSASFFIIMFHFSGFSTLLCAIFSIAKERLASCWTKMLQRIRNVLQVAGRRCYNVSGTSCKLLDKDVTTYQEIVIDNAGHRTLLHPSKTPPPKPPQPPSKTTPKKRQYTKVIKVTTVLPLEGRRQQKHAMRSKEETVNEPISFSWWSLRVENLSCKPLLWT